MTNTSDNRNLQLRVTFVNHASFLVDTCGVKLLCDPWLTGRAFNDGWALLSESVFTHEDLAQVDFIWCSHEHPDHFSPSDLTQVPQALRNNITILYQQTSDRRLLDFCRKLGFKVIELLPGEWLPLAAGIEVVCCPQKSHFESDSWLGIRTHDVTILNLNDCGVEKTVDLDALQMLGPIDVLFTQFSYAGWQGNPEDHDLRLAQSKKSLDAIRFQVDRLKPTYTVPFASFISFCHEENSYLNEDMNRIAEVAQLLDRETDSQPIVLYPGDTWVPGEKWSNQPAIDRYNADYESGPALVKAHRVVEKNLLAAVAGAFLAKHRWNIPGRLYLARYSYKNEMLNPGTLQQKLRSVVRLLTLRTCPALIWVTDHAAAYRLSANGFEAAAADVEDCDVSMTSDSLAYCFKFPWGAETLRVNGRFREGRITPGDLPWKTRLGRFLLHFDLVRRESLGDPLTTAIVARSIVRVVLGQTR